MPSEPDFRVISFQPQSGQGSGSARKYRRRKTHQKSKTGCLGCKVKRVKCDEARPSCSRCLRSSVWCNYTSDDSGSDSVSNPGEETSIVLGRKVKRFGTLDSSPAIYGFDPEESQTPYGTPRIVLMHHFQHLFPELLMLDGAQVDSILSLGLCRPFLLDSILAVSASHLRVQSTSKSSHRIAEHFQQALALKNFQGALTGPLDQQTADALILTAMFLNLLSFSSIEDESIGSSWAYSDHHDRLGWLSLSLGIKPLIYATETFRPDSILSWMFDLSDDDAKTFHGAWESINLEGVPQHWLELVGLTPDSTPDAQYFQTVRLLSETTRLEPKSEHFFLYVSMIGTLDVDFRFELERRDEAAMWLMGYWLGLLCRYDFWWCRKRVSRDYRGVCKKLQEMGVRDRPGADGVMWRKLMDDLETSPYWKGLRECGRVYGEV